MKKNNLFFAIIINSIIISIVGIVSIFTSTQVLIAIKSAESKLLFNAPIATIFAVLLFLFFDFVIKKWDRSIFFENINYTVYSAFISLICTAIIVYFVVYKTSGTSYIMWEIMQYLFILIPINAILVLTKMFLLNRKK